MNQKNVFWQALIITVFIFGVGVFAGIILENWRTSEVKGLYINSEVDLLDVKLQNKLFSFGQFDCSYAIKKNIDFANKIYTEAALLGEYERASRLTDDLIIQHKKYDLLRATVLVNSFKIKEKCNSTYLDVVYLYKYNNPSLDLKAEQNAFSKVLEELKMKYGDKILLLPMAGDNGISSIDFIMNMYDIKEEDLPIVVIDNKHKITQAESASDLEKYFD